MGLISFRVLAEGLSFRSGPAELNEHPLNLSLCSSQKRLINLWSIVLVQNNRDAEVIKSVLLSLYLKINGSKYYTHPNRQYC